jgi:hypothetical protein
MRRVDTIACAAKPSASTARPSGSAPHWLGDHPVHPDRCGWSRTSAAIASVDSRSGWPHRPNGDDESSDEWPLSDVEFRSGNFHIGSAVNRRAEEEQSLAALHREALTPTPSAAAERQVLRYSGQPLEEPAKVRFWRPPTFAEQSRATAVSQAGTRPPPATVN